MPWRITQLKKLTTQALQAGQFQKAALYFGVLLHYGGDRFQIYHSSINFDPNGVHSEYEEKQLEFIAKPKGAVLDPKTGLWNTKFLADEVVKRFSIAQQAVRADPTTARNSLCLKKREVERARIRERQSPLPPTLPTNPKAHRPFPMSQQSRS